MNQPQKNPGLQDDHDPRDLAQKQNDKPKGIKQQEEAAKQQVPAPGQPAGGE